MTVTKNRKKFALTEADFNNVKLLQSASLKASQVKAVTGWSSATVSRIFSSPTLEDYKTLTQPKPVVKVEPSDTAAPDTPDYMAVLKNINETLEALADGYENIDNRLKFIDNNLPVQPKRKFFRD